VALHLLAQLCHLVRFPVQAALEQVQMAAPLGYLQVAVEQALQKAFLPAPVLGSDLQAELLGSERLPALAQEQQVQLLEQALLQLLAAQVQPPWPVVALQQQAAQALVLAVLLPLVAQVQAQVLAQALVVLPPPAVLAQVLVALPQQAAVVLALAALRPPVVQAQVQAVVHPEE
jgi:hypothetical protein